MKTILVHIDADEGQEARLQAAFDLARGLGGHLVCLAVMPFAVYAAGDVTGGAFPVTAVIEAVEARRRAEREVVEARLRAEGVSWEWRAADGDPAGQLAEAARLADIVVMSAGPFARDGGMRLALTGDVALAAPAPVLAISPACPRIDLGAPALVAWDGSQEAAVAMRAAMPLLRLAQSVTLLTVAEKASDHPPAEAAAFLSRHGIAAEVLERAGGSVVDTIRTVARERGVGLLVQGAYGHSRLRQTLFGGVTRGLLGDPPAPLLLAH